MVGCVDRYSCAGAFGARIDRARHRVVDRERIPGYAFAEQTAELANGAVLVVVAGIDIVRVAAAARPVFQADAVPTVALGAFVDFALIPDGVACAGVTVVVHTDGVVVVYAAVAVCIDTLDVAGLDTVAELCIDTVGIVRLRETAGGGVRAESPRSACIVGAEPGVVAEVDYRFVDAAGRSVCVLIRGIANALRAGKGVGMFSLAKVIAQAGVIAPCFRVSAGLIGPAELDATLGPVIAGAIVVLVHARVLDACVFGTTAVVIAVSIDLALGYTLAENTAAPGIGAVDAVVSDWERSARADVADAHDYQAVVRVSDVDRVAVGVLTTRHDVGQCAPSLKRGHK
jgi:hypothetical protein